MITQTKATHNHMLDKTSPDNWVYSNPESYLRGFACTKTLWKTLFPKVLQPLCTCREITHRLTTHSPTTCHHPTQDSMLICIPLQRRAVSYLPKLGQPKSYLLSHLSIQNVMQVCIPIGIFPTVLSCTSNTTLTAYGVQLRVSSTVILMQSNVGRTVVMLNQSETLRTVTLTQSLLSFTP